MRVIHNSVLYISEENECWMMENGAIFTLSLLLDSIKCYMKITIIRHLTMHVN